MKEKYKRRTSDCALEKIDAVAAKFGVERDFAEVLTERGLADDKPNQDERDGFFEPFSMSNMDKAAELLNNIIKRHGKALICGDYRIGNSETLFKRQRSLCGRFDSHERRRIRFASPTDFGKVWHH